MQVTIKNLTFDCIIGILPFEREQEQQVVVNCSFKYHYTKDIFIDYSTVAQDIEALMKNKKFELLEDAILYICKKLTKKYEMNKLKLEISKPNILDNCIVSLKN